MKRLLQLISLVFILIGTFLGLIYWKGDEYLIIAIIVSLFFTIVFFFIVDMLIKNKEHIRKRKLSSLSIFLWFSFLIFSSLSAVLIIHGLNVQFNAKADIQKQMIEKKDKLEAMTGAFKVIGYNDCSDYANQLDSVLYKFIMSKDNGKIYKELSDNYNISSAAIAEITNKTDLGKKIKQKNRLRKSSEKAKKSKFDKEIKDVNLKVKKFLKNNTSAIKKWHILELNTTYYQLNNMLTDNKKQLTKAFNKHKTNKSTKFIYSISANNIPLNNPIELWKLYKPNYLYGMLAVFYLLLLSPYLIHGDKKRQYKGKTINLEGGIEI